MKKKKILFLLEAFDKGGIEKVTLDIVNHLDPEKYDITVQTFWYGGHCQSLVNENIKVIPFFFKRYVKGIIRLIQYLPPGCSTGCLFTEITMWRSPHLMAAPPR